MLLTFLVPALSLTWWQCQQETARRVEQVRAMGRLAPLPTSAHAIQTEMTGNFVSNQIWLCFTAQHDQIDRFVRDSPGITAKNAKTTPEPLDATHQTTRGMPQWFGADEVNRGRYFSIPWDKHSNYGWVLVDDDKSIVYLYVSHS